MPEKLETILSKPVDLITKRAIDRSFNPIRRQEIICTAQTLRSQIVAIAHTFQSIIIPIPTSVGVFLYPCNSFNKKPANSQSARSFRY
jgi:hypothetical protein